MRITMPQRTDLLLRIRPTINGEPVPLGNVTVEFAVATMTGKPVMDKSGTVDSDRVLVAITGQDSDIAAGVYAAELRITDIEGGRYRLGRGYLVIEPSIFVREDDDE